MVWDKGVQELIIDGTVFSKKDLEGLEEPVNKPDIYYYEPDPNTGPSPNSSRAKAEEMSKMDLDMEYWAEMFGVPEYAGEDHEFSKEDLAGLIIGDEDDWD